MSCRTHTPKSLFGNSIGDDHKCQVQGCLYVTGRQWWDVMSYHPDFPPAITRVERDETFQNALDEVIKSTMKKIDEKLEALKGLQ